MRYCTNCGAHRLEGAAFCQDCGRPLEPFTSPSVGGVWRVLGLARGFGLEAAPWRGGQVAIGVGLILLALVVVAVGSGFSNSDGFFDDAMFVWVTVHVMGLAILGVVWRLGVYGMLEPLKFLGLRLGAFFNVKYLLFAAGVLLGSLAFTVAYSVVVGLFDSDLLSPDNDVSDLAFSGAAVAFTYQAVAVVTPITEELFFRGFVMRGLMGRLGSGWALVASAVIFSLFHISPQVLVPIFVTGLLLGWLYQRTGSLWPAILAHAAQNALALTSGVYWT